VEDNSASW